MRQQGAALSLEEAQRRLGQGLVWVSLVDPTSEELADVRQRFGLHPLAVEGAGHADQRPKLQRFDDQRLLVVVRTARYDENRELAEFGEAHAFVGPGFVVVVRHGQTDPLSDARHRLEQRPELADRGPLAMAWAILDKVVDDYEPVLTGLERDIEAVERMIFEGAGDQTQRIYLLRRELSDFSRAVRPLVGALEASEHDGSAMTDSQLRDHFRAVTDHVRRLNDEALTQRYLLEGVLQANLATIAVRQNDVVRKVSGWAGIVTVPTLIASVYGMNFKQMPELGWAFGYPFALALMVASALGLWTLLRRVKWL